MTLYYPTGSLREAAELLLTTSIGERLESFTRSEPRFLVIEPTDAVISSLSSGELFVLECLRGAAGHRAFPTTNLASVDEPTARVCARAYGVLLGLVA